MLELVLGGARSGKRRYARQCAEVLSDRPWLLVTATAQDPERPQCSDGQQGGAHWQVLEVPVDLVDALAPLDQPETVVVVDCLTRWLDTLLRTEPAAVAARCDALCALVENWQGRLFLISRELGAGGVALDARDRALVERNGELQQALARCAGRVTLMVAGLPLQLKDIWQD
ncbi:MAG TPA: bifunctional adenosylcobinamide kinase/adenosylcobinamide-phosphate guanylyltransferase [Spongiibacteraceae bacterium]|jgi:adenosylcobinamide kinase/adenosylcobinamide-phosphate guanylyltransferase|nr:bifunctional adenosylcobinamide kinase/adenosylcobinamide-phosphate guanylyltransferase [Spongiibacteraceae bacterium]HUH36475.1 bifunctional adenosylcobinamide kinase/adenosylcobinamide-phosphate guanylyltransferase [Spongiibacteraceae bacterium]